MCNARPGTRCANHMNVRMARAGDRADRATKNFMFAKDAMVSAKADVEDLRSQESIANVLGDKKARDEAHRRTQAAEKKLLSKAAELRKASFTATEARSKAASIRDDYDELPGSRRELAALGQYRRYSAANNRHEARLGYSKLYKEGAIIKESPGTLSAELTEQVGDEKVYHEVRFNKFVSRGSNYAPTESFDVSGSKEDVHVVFNDNGDIDISADKKEWEARDHHELEGLPEGTIVQDDTGRTIHVSASPWKANDTDFGSLQFPVHVLEPTYSKRTLRATGVDGDKKCDYDIPDEYKRVIKNSPVLTSEFRSRQILI